MQGYFTVPGFVQQQQQHIYDNVLEAEAHIYLQTHPWQPGKGGSELSHIAPGWISNSPCFLSCPPSFTCLFHDIFFFLKPVSDTSEQPHVQLMYYYSVQKGCPTLNDVQHWGAVGGWRKQVACCSSKRPCGVHCFPASLTSFWHSYLPQTLQNGWSRYHSLGGTQDE